jgi:D-galactosamine 6-phosphate deaminase/isomerase
MAVGPPDTPRAAVTSNEPRSLVELLARPASDQRQHGYAHTAREIDQQPQTWLETARLAVRHRGDLAHLLTSAHLGPDGAGVMVLTGSGSSLYVGECVAPALQRALHVPVSAVSSGQVLTHLEGVISPGRPGLVVSFARSGDSPESAAVVDEVLAARPAFCHLVITCNREGRLATTQRENPRVLTLVLDARTCDRSLVMTSSFTNMVIAAAMMTSLDNVDGYLHTTERLAAIGREVLARSTLLAATARSSFRSVVFLGSGPRYGAAREAALKMLEMTGGRVNAMAETYLGLRHGPMCAIHDDTLVVCFLSSDAVTRAYEADLVRELNLKQLGERLIVGDEVPPEIVRDGDSVLDCSGLASVGDDFGAVTDVVVGQLLALFRCLSLGLRPDAPSSDNVINRVVGEFAIYRRYATSSEPRG